MDHPVNSIRPASPNDPLRQRNEVWRAATLLKTTYGSKALDRAGLIGDRSGRAFGRHVTAWLEYEQRRLAALHGLKVLGSDLGPLFDELVAIAARGCAAPIASVNFIDATHEWRVSSLNLPSGQRPLHKSVCARLIVEEGLVVIPDLSLDWRMREIQLDWEDPTVRFYASAPIATAEGLHLGRLCVLDTIPRMEGLTEDQLRTLNLCASQIASQMRLRKPRF